MEKNPPGLLIGQHYANGSLPSLRGVSKDLVINQMKDKI
jgi:hypothetical protein